MNKIFQFICAAALICGLTACEDFFDQESDSVIFAEKDHLNNATDTIYSVTGIMNKMQALADRTVLLGEVRADLVDINDNTDADLRDMALFNISDSNAYNAPKDYYAVINNCNYFLAKADTTLKNNRNEKIFQKEYAAVKAFRAWTYLQLVLNYGSVPFVTEPILTKEAAESNYPKYNIQQVCEYFINDLKGWENIDMPGYGTVGSSDSRFFYYPINVLLGDLNLWAGNYLEAAKNYYGYISKRNGTNSAYPTTTNAASWDRDGTKYIRPNSAPWSGSFFGSSSENYNNTSELIFMIAGDSIPAYGNYSQLKTLFCSSSDNDYEVQLTPSQAIIDLSADQVYCQYTSTGDTIYVPKGLGSNMDGDLRLSSCWTTGTITYKKRNIDFQSVAKFNGIRNVHLLRRANVYLRFAEAINRAGYPRMAFQVLQTGLNNDVIDQRVIPYYGADSTVIRQFDFPTTNYVLRTNTATTGTNTLGIHGRGSGWPEYNEYYTMPDDTTLSAAARLQYQIEAVEDLIIDEDALETAFEGQRFYDLMRVALRRSDPSYLADRVYSRRGADNAATMKSEIQKDLTNTSNWYLSWKGLIGF